MKKILVTFAVFTAFVGVAAYAAFREKKKDDIRDFVSGHTFVRERGGFGSDFVITFNQDGTVHYYEGALSSHMGMGEWYVENSTIVLKEGGRAVWNTEEDTVSVTEMIIRFQVKDGALVFQKEGSGRFLYIDLEDGERFLLKK